MAGVPAHVESVRRHFIDVPTGDGIAALAALSHRVVERLNATVAAPGRGGG